MRPMNTDIKLIGIVCMIGYMTYAGCRPENEIRQSYSEKALAICEPGGPGQNAPERSVSKSPEI